MIKISGEAMGCAEGIYDDDFLDRLATEIAQAGEEGYKIGVVIGGGNIWRGAGGKSAGMDSSDADYMGMLATGINALRLKDSLLRCGVDPRVMSAIRMDQVSEPFIRGRALKHLTKGRVVVLAAGTGNPHCTTDYASALRAVELKADLLLKGTHGDVDGVYTADPKIDRAAKKFKRVPFKVVLDQELEVMDTEAISLCRRNHLPVRVFNIREPGNLALALAGDSGTLISDAPEIVMAGE